MSVRATVQLLAWLVVFDAAVLRAQSDSHRATLADLGYGAEQLSEATPRVEYWLELPGHWSMEQGSAFELAYSHASAEHPSSAEVVVTVNGQEAHRFVLGSEATPLKREAVPIPVLSPLPAGLHVIVEYFPRGHEIGCVEPDERVLTVRELSAFDIRHTLRPADEDLAALPYPLAWERAQEPIPVTFVVPARRNVFEMNAAARIASWLGQHAGASPFHFRVLLDEEWTSEALNATNAVIIASDALRLPDMEPGPCRGAATSTSPALAICRSSSHPHFGVLWVAGGDEVAMSETVEVLTTRSGELSGCSSDVSGLGEPGARLAPWSETRTTLEALGVHEVMYRGVGEQVRTFYFRRPRGWQLGEDSELALHVGVADKAETSIQVALNGTELGQFGPQDIEEDYLHVNLPSGPSLNRDDQGRPADYLVLTIKVTQRIADTELEDCDPRSEEAWTLIHGDSYFDIVSAEPNLPDLYWFPFPFTRPDGALMTSMVVSPMAEEDELAAGVTVAAEFGRSALATLPTIQLLRSTDWGAREGHVVLLGAPAVRGWQRMLGQDAPEITLERREPPSNSPIGAPIGQLIAAQTPRQDQLLILEADPGHLVTVAEALHRSKPSGLHMLVDAESQAVAVDETFEGSFRSLGEFGERLRSAFRFGPLHWLLLATNLVTLLLWWQAARRRRSRA